MKVVEANDRQNLVNVGVLDVSYSVLENLVLSLSREGLTEERDAAAKLRDMLFNAKMDLRRALWL